MFSQISDNSLITTGLVSVFWNVVGGCIVAVLTLVVSAIRKNLRNRSFRSVFGSIPENEYYLIYPVQTA